MTKRPQFISRGFRTFKDCLEFHEQLQYPEDWNIVELVEDLIDKPQAIAYYLEPKYGNR
jgi:hypothetical protein